MATQEASKAARIRHKLKNGTPVGKRNRAWLDQYEKTKSKPGGSKKSKVPKPATVIAAATAEPPDDRQTELPLDAVDDADQGGDVKPPAAEKTDEPTGRPTPDAPPAVLGRGKSRGDGNGWRDRYRKEQGREATCVEAAVLLTFALKKMNAAIIEAGDRPWVDNALIDSTIFPSAVLTADMLLPAGFEMRPEVSVTVGATVVTTQRLIVARKMAKARKPKPSEPKPDREPVKAPPVPEPEPRAKAATDLDPEPARPGDVSQVKIAKAIKEDPDALY